MITIQGRNEREVLRALFQSLKLEYEDVRWRRYGFDVARLCVRLSTPEHKVNRAQVAQIVDHLSVFVLRSDAIRLTVQGFEKKFDRQSIAEGLGSAGVQFFPTHQSANRSAFESSREALYFGYGSLKEQFMACPIEALCALREGREAKEEPNATVFRDLREGFETTRTVCEMLSQDCYFNGDASTPEKFVALQKQIRATALSGEVAEKLEFFFNRRMTIGVRDTLRWTLGARHPRFNWDRAKELLEGALERHQSDNFNTPKIVYYTYDPSIEECEIVDAERNNELVIAAFGNKLRETLNEASLGLGDQITDMAALCRWVLDIHHDYPDFDLESSGKSDAAAHIEFLRHSIQSSVSSEILGDNAQMRKNFNFRAHFAACDLERRFLGALSAEERDIFYDVVDDLIRGYDEKNGIVSDEGIIMYRRLPATLFVIQNRGDSAPAPGERLLDAFDLSRMTQLEHASYMRSFVEISEKLVLFFVLTLRHMMETDHAPDLRPRDLMKDFLLLGLWGTRTPNILVNLYVDENTDLTQPIEKLSHAEVRFVGCEQVEIHALNHLDVDAKALRFIVSQCLPLIEPSILRNIGTFTMALDEFENGCASYDRDMDIFGIFHYGMDMIHEIGRVGIRGSISDTLSFCDFLIHSTINDTGRIITNVSKWVKKHREQKDKEAGKTE